MATNDSRSNMIFYVIGGLALLGFVGACCLGGGAWLLVARRASDEVEAEAAERTRAARESREVEAPAQDWLGREHVSLVPPPSLGLRPRPTDDRRTRHIVASITEVQGSIGLSVGDRCEFDVLVLDRRGPPGHFCRTFAECGGVRLFGQDYPNRNGFFPCELYDLPFGVAGEDLEPTVSYSNGDPMFQIDTRARRFMAADNTVGLRGTPYRVTARIEAVSPR